MILRPERRDDRDAAIEVERAAFGTLEEPAIVEAIGHEPGSFALVAEEGGDVIGHVQLSTAWVGEDEVLALGPIAVMPAHQGHGIGTALVAAALTSARERGTAAVILLGAPSYYGARGFEPAATYGLTNPYAGVTEGGFVIAEEDFQLAVLDRDRVATLTGQVRWHPAFG